MRQSVMLLCLGALIPLGSEMTLAQDERLSIDSIFSEEGKQSCNLPQHAWLASGIRSLAVENIPAAQAPQRHRWKLRLNQSRTFPSNIDIADIIRNT